MKKFFGKIKNWIVNHVPTKRRIIQLYAALLHNAHVKGFITGKMYQGNIKKLCMPGLNCYSCPGAIGACPLGSLQNALAASNVRTPTYVLGILALFALILGRTICGGLCPGDSACHDRRKAGRRCKRRRRRHAADPKGTIVR